MWRLRNQIKINQRLLKVKAQSLRRTASSTCVKFAILLYGRAHSNMTSKATIRGENQRIELQESRTVMAAWGSGKPLGLHSEGDPGLAYLQSLIPSLRGVSECLEMHIW